MEERWTADHVLSLAPDAASRKAAAKLSSPAPWSQTGADGESVWGLCKGSGTAAYRTVVDLAAPAYSCTCPSRKFPCKHALGLLLLWADHSDAVPGGAAPADWAAQWLASRRQRTEQQRQRAADAGAADPAAARRRAERRAARVAAGAEELRLRLADRLRAGLAGEEHAGYDAWDPVAARMVDAQAPGLAARVRELGSIPGSGPGWPGRLLEEYALLDMLSCAYGRIDTLPAPLAATVRARVGFSVDSAEVLRGPAVHDRWLVLGSHDTADDRLTTRRLWLRGARTGRAALLLAFGRPGQAPDLAMPTGMVVEAEVAYHPGARPLRAVLGTRHQRPTAASADEAVPPGVGIGQALEGYGAALRDDPWLDSWPTVLADVLPVPVAGPEGWRLVDADGRESLPVHRQGTAEAGLWRLAAVSAGRPVTVFGECGHRGFAPVTVWAADGSVTEVRR
jgi:hypothetical protein